MLVWKPCGFYSTRTDLSSVWRYVYIITFIQAIYRVCVGRHINLIMHLGLFVLTRATNTTIVNAQARTPLKTNQIRLSIANVSLILTMASERYVYLCPSNNLSVSPSHFIQFVYLGKQIAFFICLFTEANYNLNCDSVCSPLLLHSPR